ncbi:MAG: thioesterase family protein [Bacteroidota bacterium]
MFTHETKQRVRYGDTDKMGYLYYGNYPLLYEIARTEMLRSLGLTYRDMEDIHGILMPVMRMDIRYIRPAYYDDLLTLKTTLREWPSSSAIFTTEIFSEAGDLLNSGTVKLCFLDKSTKQRIDTPTYLLKAIQPFFTEEDAVSGN